MNRRTVTVRESQVESSFEVYTFGEEGAQPAITFTAGVHGNEVTGMYVARKLIERFTEQPPVQGCVKIIPTVNPTALRCMQRRCPFDREDLNRIFPGNSSGSLSHRIADAVYRETADAQLLVDLHCCSQFAEPYILSVYSENPRIRALVSRITLPIALHSEGTGGQLFTEACRRREQAACIIELPSGACDGAIHLDAASKCLSALEDLLRSVQIWPGEVQGKAPSFYGKILDLTAPASGLWTPHVKKGQRVRAGETIGEVDGQPLKAERECTILSLVPTCVLLPDDLDVGSYLLDENA